MKKLIILFLLSIVFISCRYGFTFYDLGGTWKKNGSTETFIVDTSSKTIVKGNLTCTINGEIPETKSNIFKVILISGSINVGSITFTSKTEANGTDDFYGNWTKQ
ncbi:hypothetical protein [Brachyspira murdochii]|uniref:Lipoprotein n=1 Tax=Brachyspira murdochii (strain ATCC 51284 / DSM 12563 / 56-150) TaxID=526224 RepID=D5UA05_BRAM5|nr:hypothetical protein [Brachyspira murdochii]ADG71528.1 hypothetical protein Bmur_1440 [Brachyspira murdochii DSM 12563]